MRAILLNSGSVLFLILLSVGCGTKTCTIDPSSAGYGCSDTRQNELERQQLKSQHLEHAIEQSRKDLTMSESRLKELEGKLISTKFRTQKSRDEAAKLAKELKTKELELMRKKKELSKLEAKIVNLKSRKMGKKEELARVTQAENELTQKKKEISVLTNYLRDDLFLRAENALLFD